MKAQKTNTVVDQNVQTLNDLKTSVLIVSLVANLYVVSAWLVIAVS